MNFRKRLTEIKEGFLDAKTEKMLDAFILANSIFISVIAAVIFYISLTFLILSFKKIFCIIAIITLLTYLLFEFHPYAFEKTLPFSMKILFYFFGRYGRVVTKQDWKNIKKFCPKLYKQMWSKEHSGYCYFFSWAIALYLEDAQIMYCSIESKSGATGHAVIVKNNCVFDTNSRMHYDFEEYKKSFGVNIYKFFSYEEYCKENFFNNIREDFSNWCSKNNVYCDPQ